MRKTLINLFCLGSFILVPGNFPAHAGYYDCSVVYDEFDSLMNKDFLIEPDRFVAILAQRITKSQFEKQQRGRFLLYAERAQLGIAIFRTNENLHGKMLYQWADPLSEGQSYLIIEEVVTYGRVKDGYAQQYSGPYRIKPGLGLDLDSGQYSNELQESTSAENDTARVDVRHELNLESLQATFTAGTEAALVFPIETLCHKPG